LKKAAAVALVYTASKTTQSAKVELKFAAGTGHTKVELLLAVNLRVHYMLAYGTPMKQF
jgi:hypothetical protein